MKCRKNKSNQKIKGVLPFFSAINSNKNMAYNPIHTRACPINEAFTDPIRERKKLSGEMVCIRSLRVWPYRVLYEVKENRAEVHKISHRQGAYK